MMSVGEKGTTSKSSIIYNIESIGRALSPARFGAFLVHIVASGMLRPEVVYEGERKEKFGRFGGISGVMSSNRPT